MQNRIHYFRWTAGLIVVTNSFLTGTKNDKYGTVISDISWIGFSCRSVDYMGWSSCSGNPCPRKILRFRIFWLSVKNWGPTELRQGVASSFLLIDYSPWCITHSAEPVMLSSPKVLACVHVRAPHAAQKQKYHNSQVPNLFLTIFEILERFLFIFCKFPASYAFRINVIYDNTR